MTALLVDSSVLLDVATENAAWSRRSRDAVVLASATRELVINPVIFAEVSISFDRIEAVDNCLSRTVFRREDIPWEAAFLAGKAFVSYRKRGGTRRSPLPDFFIGAHAAVRGYELLTRDPAGFQSYFPNVVILSPEQFTP